MKLEQYCGDAVTHTIPMVLDGQSYTPAEGDNLIFTAKDKITDTDANAVFQKQLGAGIEVVGSSAKVTTVFEDTGTHAGGTVFFDIQAQLAEGGTPKTVAYGKLVLVRDVTRLLETSVPVHTTNPPVPFGKSAYDVAVDNGFEGNEEEWLESLVGETGAHGTTVSVTPPANPEAGQFWYDPEDAVMSFWTGSEWVTHETAITSGEQNAFAKALIFG